MIEPQTSAAAGTASGLAAFALEAASLNLATVLWGLAGGLFALARTEPVPEPGKPARTSRQAAVYLALAALSAAALAELAGQVVAGMLGDGVSATAIHRAMSFSIGFGAQSAAPRLLDAGVNAVSAALMRVFGGGNKP